MQLLNEAYSVLKDPSEKEIYDYWYHNIFKKAIMHILDYEKGYVRKIVPAGDCAKIPQKFKYGNEVFVYVINKDKGVKPITVEAFDEMYELYHADELYASIVYPGIRTDHKKIKTALIENNYRQYITPYSNNLYLKKTDTGYVAITFKTFSALVQDIIRRNKKRKLVGIVLAFVILIVFIIIVNIVL